MRNQFILLLGIILLSSCQGLVTRSELSQIESKQQIQQQVSTLQKTTADTNQRFLEIEEQLRKVTNQVEVLEHNKSKSTEGLEGRILTLETQVSELTEKNKILQEELISRLQNKPAEDNDRSSGRGATASNDSFAIAEGHFAQKEWKSAILAYQKYREKNPKGKKLAESSYKIGVSFQELGMKQEAKTFYENVISQFPKSIEAKKSQTRLKSLK